MRKLGMACLVGVLVGGACLRAQETRQADHEALRELKDKVVAAVNQQDMKTLNACLAKEFTFTTLNQRTATRPEDIQAIFDDFFRGPKAIISTLKTNPEVDSLTRFIDANTGIAQGSSKETYVLKTGKTIDLVVRWTATVVKEADGWKVAAIHVGLDPLENPILAASNDYWKKAAMGSIAGALVAGLFVGWLIGRRRSAV